MHAKALFAIVAASFLIVPARFGAAQDQSAATAGANSATPLSTIASLDVQRYMGTWYELAKYPNRFQKQCAGYDRAEYTLRNDGTVQVVNRCKLENGEWNAATGTARQIGPATSPKFEVRFAPAWLSFIPAVWGDYWVIDLDENYELAAVSEPERQNLWILSRKPDIPAQKYEALLKRLESKGFDLQKLVPTKQEGKPGS